MPDISHKVLQGESLSVIAQRYGTTVKALVSANHINNPARIRTGQMLRIPGRRGHVAFLLQGNNACQMDELQRLMAGFDDWAVFTLEQLPVETQKHETFPRAPFALDILPPWNHHPLSGGLGAAAALSPSWLWSSPGWHYYYRALAVHQPTLAQILAGQDVLPRPTNAGTPYEPTRTRAEMTMRHLDTRGDQGLVKGTNRISLTRNVKLAYELSLREGSSGEIIRVNSRNLVSQGADFLHSKQLLVDLDKWERETRQELNSARSSNSKTKIQRYEIRLQQVEKARAYLRRWAEAHAVERIPAGAVKPVRVAAPWSQQLARGGQMGLRVGGGALMVYGVYSSYQRISEAPRQQRGRVVTQEVGGWAGGFAGAWALGSLFAMGGAVVGVPAGGVGALIVGAAGGLVGGVIGGVAGAMGADWVYSMIEEQDADQQCRQLMGKPRAALPYSCTVQGDSSPAHRR
jgi:LysM repeat protein